MQSRSITNLGIKPLFKKEKEFTKIIVAAFGIYNSMFRGNPRDLSGEEYTDITIRIQKGKFLRGEADPKFIAEFYAFKTASKLGSISPKESLAYAVIAVGYYSSAQGLGKVSIRSAAKSDQSKMDNYFLIYNGGWVIAMIVDHDIRKKTDNQYSLDDLMSSLYRDFQRHQKLYSISDIVTVIKNITGIDCADFVSANIQGKKTIPVSQYFDLGRASWGLTFNREELIEQKYLLYTLRIESKY
jgi:hypothetical protein